MAKHGDGTRRNVTNQVKKHWPYFSIGLFYWSDNFAGLPYGDIPRWTAMLQTQLVPHRPRAGPDDSQGQGSQEINQFIQEKFLLSKWLTSVTAQKGTS